MTENKEIPTPKFVQITTARLDNNRNTQADWILHALDEQGRIWQLDNMHDWHEVAPPIMTVVTP